VTFGDRIAASGGTLEAVEPLATPVGDRTLIERILANLVDNAVRHARSSVVLAVRAEGGRAVLTVVDDGPGIPAGERERVFERFARLDDARDRDAGGTGLGLAIVRELLRRSGGSISLEDNPDGQGLTAVVHLAR